MAAVVRRSGTVCLSVLSTAGQRHAARALATLSEHRPFGDIDVEACRRVKTGKHISPTANPGIRIESKWLGEGHAQRLVAELLSLKDTHGFPAFGHGLSVISVQGRGPDSESGTEKAAGEIESLRVTGRQEGQERPAPWGHGTGLRPEAAPPQLAALLAGIQTSRSYHLGPLVDLTINFRGNSFFRLDPTPNPAPDVTSVVMVPLLSDAVLTFVPPDSALKKGFIRRSDPLIVARDSWTDKDIDVLLQQCSMVHISGDALHKWQYGIRGGLEIDQGGTQLVVDWWGKQDFYLRRSRDLITVVLSYAGPS